MIIWIQQWKPILFQGGNLIPLELYKLNLLTVHFPHYCWRQVLSEYFSCLLCNNIYIDVIYCFVHEQYTVSLRLFLKDF